jgi:pilus assembly protein CpaB
VNRRTRTLVVIGVAVALAGLASYAVYRAVKQIPVQMVEVVERQQVVAKAHIPVGVLVSPEQVQLKPWPASSPIPGGFTSIEEVIGRGVVSGFVANEPLIEAKLAPRESGGGLPPLIPRGMRALSVRVNDTIGVAGYTVPGTRVDVVMTTRSSTEPISKVVLSNVQVLAAGTKYEEDLARREPMKVSVVTLLLTPEDAERLTLATDQGAITLALRNPLDTAPTETNGIRMPGLLMNSAPPPPPRPTPASRPRVTTPPPPPPPPQNDMHKVEVILGTDRKETVVKCTPPCSPAQ